MNDNHFSEQDLIKKLTSGEVVQIEQVLTYIYLNTEWQASIQKIMPCPLSFFETHFIEFIASIKAWFLQEKHQQKLIEKGMKKTFFSLWRAFVFETIEDDDLLTMFRTDFPMFKQATEICYRRYYTKIFSVLMNIEPSKEGVEDVLLHTFFYCFKTFKKENFFFSKNMEAYLVTSCKRDYIKSLKKKKIPFENIESLKEFAFLEEHLVHDIDEERKRCYAKKVYPELGDTCKKVFDMAANGFKNPEIAEAFGRKVQNIKVQKSKCLKKAKKLANDLCK